jgi:hypothetical protein
MIKFCHVCVLLVSVGAFAGANASTNLLPDAPFLGDQSDRAVLSINDSRSTAANAPLVSLDSRPEENYDRTFGSVLDGIAFNYRGSGFAMASADSLTNVGLHSQQNLALSGGPGETVSLDLQSFVLRDEATLTLEGTTTTSFVMNVSKQFSLSGSSRIVLTGGLRWNHVFFNVLGVGRAVSLKGAVTLVGILTADQRTVQMRGHAFVYGSIAARRLAINGAAQIVPPPVASP